MNTPLTNKNLVVYNDQPLDTWHDIVISFDYARYNEVIVPTGGFAVVFFDSVVNMPRNGGPGYSLGYTPGTSDLTYCNLTDYRGLEAAYLGIGFDSLGRFAEQTTFVNGVSTLTENSFTVRDGIETNYNLIYQSPNIKFLHNTLHNFYVDSLVSSNSAITYNTIRIILKKTGTHLTVQIKSPETNEFVDVGNIVLSEKKRTALKVGITNTTLDPYTKFDIRNFNVAGYPGSTTQDILNTCEQNITLPSYSNGPLLPTGEEFITVSTENQLVTYTTDTNLYRQKNTVFSGSGITILGNDDTSILCKYNGGTSLLVFQYLGERLTRTDNITIPDSLSPTCADIDGNTLVVCTSGLSGTMYIYRFNDEVNGAPAYGTWNLYQTFYAQNVPNGTGLGNAIQIYGDNIAVGNTYQYVHTFQKNSNNFWEHLQNISSPVSGISKFGSVLQLEGRDLLIGAPYSYKPSYFNPGQGDVFHYFLSTTTNNWFPVMALGEFYDLNTPGGNFGTSVSLRNNMCAIGSPGEMWLDDPDQTYENNPNTGRVYVFQKTSNGLFTQGTILTPPSAYRQSYMQFGNGVGVNDDYISVLSPFDNRYNKSYLHIFDTRCTFEQPPLHLPIPDCSYTLIDGSGFVIDYVNNTYMIALSC